MDRMKGVRYYVEASLSNEPIVFKRLFTSPLFFLTKKKNTKSQNRSKHTLKDGRILQNNSRHATEGTAGEILLVQGRADFPAKIKVRSRKG